MRRHELSDADWKRLEPLLPVRPGPRSKRGDRDFVNAVIWRVKTGVPWRDLPERFGAWKTVYNRFSRWAKRGVWERLFKELAIEVDEVGSLLDATIVRAHQDAAGGKGGVRRNHLGRSRGGVSTKIHAVTTTQGRPLHVTLTQGHRHEALKAEELIEHARGRACIADSGYDAARIREAIRARGMKPVIASNPTRAAKPRLDRKLYRLRYMVECGFHRLKRFRAVATRYEKTGTNFLALVHVACISTWLN